ncbi:hypothetical protein EVAR_32449_1 [Eumeta japonica]|uniref:Uncharacterized protein n=1 Tax=Eumeta variegata TaxID=151549 RepID=A0A4C1VP15_EUMVA|nr:hypothetical protein EVAR_32449_1 [Eumeta japonica]
MRNASSNAEFPGGAGHCCGPNDALEKCILQYCSSCANLMRERDSLGRGRPPAAGGGARLITEPTFMSACKRPAVNPNDIGRAVERRPPQSAGNN